MTVYVLIREDQNEHGYIDTSINGVFRDEHVAREREALERQEARERGLGVEDEASDGNWEVSWAIQKHVVS